MLAPAPPSAVFLDLDGCLVDSTRAITGSLNHALETVGLPPRAIDELVRFIGPPLADNVRTLLSEAGADPELAATLVDVYRARYVEVAATDTTVVEGMPAALDLLGQSARLAVVTSKPASFAIPILEATGLAARFVAVHAPDKDEQAEPKTETLRRALADVAADDNAATTVMVGDRWHDVAAGRACGTATVGVTWGAGDRDELVAAGADVVVDTPAELTDVLAGPQ